MAKRLVGQRRELPSWARRAMNPDTETLGGKTVFTHSSVHPRTGNEILYPTVRMGRDGKLRQLGARAAKEESLKKRDYISFGKGKTGSDAATAYSKKLSNIIGHARKSRKPSGAR